MYPFNYNAFGFPVAMEELDENSDKTDLWAEVKKLREELVTTKADLKRDLKVMTERFEAVVEAKAIEKKPVLVLMGVTSNNDIQAFTEAWDRNMGAGSMVIGLEPGLTLEDLDDQELAQIGLRRISTKTITARDLYDANLLNP